MFLRLAIILRPLPVKVEGKRSLMHSLGSMAFLGAPVAETNHSMVGRCTGGHTDHTFPDRRVDSRSLKTHCVAEANQNHTTGSATKTGSISQSIPEAFSENTTKFHQCNAANIAKLVPQMWCGLNRSHSCGRGEVQRSVHRSTAPALRPQRAPRITLMICDRPMASS